LIEPKFPGAQRSHLLAEGKNELAGAQSALIDLKVARVTILLPAYTIIGLLFLKRCRSSR
jgi:hypothetical protein